ncbi:hypothetical protein BRM3_14895 (plasmid) [Brachybacterium huguangmaarense]|uniref:Helix-turn-helix domain-containing protein n=1 Tax=Brachybacterium huguangmaarense TaxID=1652028 RepID=A0ABY6G678_9MICO|nr:hypothetical protein [Brachybacterium huguangmaarense]UYG18311.1 hypothetical protein BRM3_14895 [Brachybacterium huguangmaarense]
MAIDAQRASTPQSWVSTVMDHPEVATARRDVRASIERLATLLAGASERGSLLVRRLTWDRLAELLECTTRTVARLLSRLHSCRLLGRVAPGRSAQYAPLDESGERHAESAVYVLAVPSAGDVHAVDSGDESVTPPHPPVSSNTPSRASAMGAHEAASLAAMEEARQSGRRLSGPADRRLIEGLPASHRSPFWDVHRVPATRVEMLAAAAEMRRRSLPLRRASLRAIRAAARDFWVSGWSVADVLAALDHRPDGSLWPHSGAHGVRSVRAWTCYRLRRWRDRQGQPIRSTSTRRREERMALLAQQETDRLERLAARQRAAERPATAATRQLVEEARRACRAGASRLRHPQPTVG